MKKKKPVDDTKPVPAPQFRDRKSVKSMVDAYEQNIIPPPPPQFRDRKPIPKPRTRKSVKSMIDTYEQNIILPPLEFRDDYKPTPAPSTKKLKTEKPVPAPKTKKEEVAFNHLIGYYGIKIIDEKDPLVQLHNTRKTACCISYYK